MQLIHKSILTGLIVFVFGLNACLGAEESVPPLSLMEQLNAIGDGEASEESAQDPGQDLLDEAILLKMNLTKLSETDRVIELCKSALKKGLSASNEVLAKSLMRSTYIQHGQILVENIQDGTFTDDQQIQIAIQLALQDFKQALDTLPEGTDVESFDGADITWYNLALLHFLMDPKGEDGVKALAHAKKLCKGKPQMYAKILSLEAEAVKDPEKQIALLREAVKNDDDLVSAHRIMAQLLVQLKRNDEALAELKIVMKKEKNNPVDLLLYSVILEEINRPKEALTVIQTLREMLPKAEKLAMTELRLALKTRNNDLVMKTSEEILKTNPSDETILLLRAALFSEQKQYEKALHEIDQLLFFDNDNLRAKLLKLEVLCLSGDKEEAWKIAKPLMARILEAKETDKADSEASWAVFLRVESLGKEKEAMEFAEKLSNKSEEDKTRYLLMLANTAIKKENLNEAARLAHKVLQSNPKDSFALIAIEALTKAKQYDEAIEACQKGAKKSKADPELSGTYRIALAYALVGKGQTEKADDLIFDLSEDKKTSDDLLKQLIGYYQSRKNPKRVVAVLETLLKRNPANDAYMGLMVYALMDLKDYQRINELYQKLIDVSVEPAREYNNYSWFLSTCPDDAARDGKKALKMAQKAAVLSEFKESYILSTLAAAYAENGDFDKALEWIQKGLDVADSDELRKNLKKEQKSYLEKKPWREKSGLDQLY